MSRPATLAEAVARAARDGGAAFGLPEFVDALHAATPERRPAMLAEEPAPTGDRRLDALAAAVAEYMAKRLAVPEVPPWCAAPWRVLPEPWFTTPSPPSPGMAEYLAFASPAEFRARNIFTEAEPLRRARPPVERSRDRVHHGGG